MQLELSNNAKSEHDINLIFSDINNQIMHLCKQYYLPKSWAENKASVISSQPFYPDP